MTDFSLEEQEQAEMRQAERRDAEEAARFDARGESRRVHIIRPLYYYPYVVAGGLALIVRGQGSVVGAALIVAVAVFFAFLRPKRVNGFLLGPDNSLSLGRDGRERLDFAAVQRLDVAYFVPWRYRGTSRAAAGELLIVRFVLATGQKVVFARGNYFEARPTGRTPLPYSTVERWLKKAAKHHGLAIETLSDKAWVATPDRS